MFFSESSAMSVAMVGAMFFLIGRLKKPPFQALDSLSSMLAQMNVSCRLSAVGNCPFSVSC